MDRGQGGDNGGNDGDRTKNSPDSQQRSLVSDEYIRATRGTQNQPPGDKKDVEAEAKNDQIQIKLSQNQKIKESQNIFLPNELINASSANP